MNNFTSQEVLTLYVRKASVSTVHRIDIDIDISFVIVMLAA